MDPKNVLVEEHAADIETTARDEAPVTDGALALALAPAEETDDTPGDEKPVTREQRRSRRKREVRARTISVKRMTKWSSSSGACSTRTSRTS